MYRNTAYSLCFVWTGVENYASNGKILVEKSGQKNICLCRHVSGWNGKKTVEIPDFNENSRFRLKRKLVIKFSDGAVYYCILLLHLKVSNKLYKVESKSKFTVYVHFFDTLSFNCKSNPFLWENAFCICLQVHHKACEQYIVHIWDQISTEDQCSTTGYDCKILRLTFYLAWQIFYD